MEIAADDIGEFDFDEIEAEELLQALYSPGLYSEGEECCIEILEDIEPNSNLAKRFLLLNLAAQDLEEEALELIDQLDDSSLFEVLSQLAFGEGTQAEEAVYEDVLLCAEQRGLDSELNEFLTTKVQPLFRYNEDDDVVEYPPIQQESSPLIREKSVRKKKKRVIRRVVRKVRRRKRP